MFPNEDCDDTETGEDKQSNGDEETMTMTMTEKESAEKLSSVIQNDCHGNECARREEYTPVRLEIHSDHSEGQGKITDSSMAIDMQVSASANGDSGKRTDNSIPENEDSSKGTGNPRTVDIEVNTSDNEESEDDESISSLQKAVDFLGESEYCHGGTFFKMFCEDSF